MSKALAPSSGCGFLCSPSPSSSPHSNKRLSAGAVAGIALAVVADVVVVILVLWYRHQKKRKQRAEGDENVVDRPPAKANFPPAAAPLASPTDDFSVLDPATGRYSGGPQPLTSSSSEQTNTTFISVTSPSTIASKKIDTPPLRKQTFGFQIRVFSYEELADATDGFSDSNGLGLGGFGFVYKGVLSNGTEVAVKSMRADTRQGDNEFEAEIETISRVHHKHLVSLVGYCTIDSKRLLVYEFIPNGTLQFHLHGKNVPVMSWVNRMKVAVGAAKGLAYLHEDCHPKIIHRDIKAANILLDFDFEAKVADFGLAKFTSDQNTHVSTRVMGTFGYLAPEYAASGKLTAKSDIYSFGVMLLELITGRLPFDMTGSEMDENLVDWAKPVLQKALEDGNFGPFVDAKLDNKYNHDEMTCMVACAAASICYTARRRPKMSQIVRALEGHMSSADLIVMVSSGHGKSESGGTSSEYGGTATSASTISRETETRNLLKD